MKKLLILSILGLTGCAYHPVPVSVYGHSGTSYQAPNLCAALTKCINSNETSCFYNTETVADQNGRVEVNACKEVRK